nr:MULTISPECIES: cyclic lactone autoinducer peptide [Pelotomaculum]
MKKYKTLFFLAAVSLLTFLASIASASACIGSHYQPEVPKSLRK